VTSLIRCNHEKHETPMDRDELHQLLQAVRRGETPVEEAGQRLRSLATFQTLGGYATVDHHRRVRCGFPEVVFGQGKTAKQIEGILRALLPNGDGCLVTRMAPEIAEHVCRAFPEGEYNAVARTFRIAPSAPAGPKLGIVRIVTAGTSDLPVAEEARVTAECWNCDVKLIADVGVAGIHRLFGRLEELRGADVIVAVAGMEAALPSVLGGLVDCPVIGVPTSIGYGASFGGIAALLGMLNSCSSSVVVVNIDAGFNGGHVASLIARRAALARASSESPQTEPS
jgi:pyridinium-3,5-biscarboxylic acid mononucleotide synthase